MLKSLLFLTTDLLMPLARLSSLLSQKMHTFWNEDHNIQIYTVHLFILPICFFISVTILKVIFWEI